MTEINSSLLPVDQRPALPPAKSPRGNYAESVIAADFRNNVGALQSVTPATDYTIVLFTQDYPVSASALWSYDSPNIFHGANQIAEDLMTIEQRSGSTPGAPAPSLAPTAGAALIVATDAPTGAGDEGIFTINAVEGVNGYVLTGTSPNPDWRSASGGAGPVIPPDFNLFAVADSGVVHGVAVMQDTAANASSIPFLLLASHYTAAIRDANNTFTIAAGAVAGFAGTVLVKVVGVFEVG